MPSYGWGFVPSPEEAWAQLQSRLESTFPGQTSFGSFVGGGRRQVSVGADPSSRASTLTLGYDPQTGMFESSGRFLYPTRGYEAMGGVGGALSMIGRVAAGYDPAEYEEELIQNDPYSPFIHQRKSMFDTEYGQRGFTGGQIYAPWTAQQSTMRFMGTMGETPYTDVQLGLDRATPGTHFLPSGLNRRAWGEGFGALGSSMHAVYGTLPGFDITGSEVTLPYKDVKMRERQDLVAPGRMPWLYGGKQTNPLMTGRYSGIEQRQSLSMMTEFIPGGIFPGAGQSYFASSAFKGVEQSFGKTHKMELPFRALSLWAQGGSRPVSELYGEVLGQKQVPGTTLGTFAGIEFGTPPPGKRGLTGFEPMGANLMLPYGSQFGKLLQQYNPSFFEGSAHAVVGGERYAAEHLMSKPSQLDDITAYRQLAGQALTPDVKRAMGGGMGVHAYQPMSPSAKPYIEYGGQEYWRPQSGMAMYAPGMKSVGLGLQSLSGMASDPRTELVVGGESIKSMQFLMGGLAQTLKPEDWGQFGVGKEHFDPKGRLKWTGQPEVTGAVQQMFDPANRSRFQNVLHQAGGFISEKWRQFPAGADVPGGLDPSMKYSGGLPQHGQWRQTEGGTSMYLQSIGLRQPITPIDPYGAGETGLSFNYLAEIARQNPQALQYLGGDPTKRGDYGSIVKAAVGQTGQSPIGGIPANLMESARGISTAALSKLNPEWGQMVADRTTEPYARHVLEALQKERPGQFTRVGEALIPPAGALLATQSFGVMGQSVSPLGGKAVDLLRAGSSGMGEADLAALSGDYQKTLEGWSSQPKVLKTMFGSSMPGSISGRITYLGGMGLPEGQFGMVLPDKLVPEGATKALAAQWPGDVIPAGAGLVGSLHSVSEYNRWAKETGASVVDPGMFKTGQVGIVGSMLQYADVSQRDVDRDILGVMPLTGDTSGLPLSDVRAGSAHARARLGGFSKGADAMAMAGYDLGQFVSEKMRTITASSGDIRERAAVTARAKGSVGQTSNLMDMMKYYTEQHRQSLSGTAKELYGTAQTDASSLMGAMKQGFIDQWPAQMGMSEAEKAEYLLPMSLSGFKGKYNLPGSFTYRTPVGHEKGRMEIEGRISPSRSAIGAGEIFPAFARSTAKMGRKFMEPEVLQSALAGMFGGFVEGGQITGLPTGVGGFLSGLARGEDPVSPSMDVAQYEGFLRGSPFGKMILEQTAFKAHQESGDIDAESPDWKVRRAEAIKRQIPGIRGIDGMLASHAEAIALTRVGRNPGAIEGARPGSGLTRVDDVLRVLEGPGTGHGVYDDVRALLGVGGKGEGEGMIDIYRTTGASTRPSRGDRPSSWSSDRGMAELFAEKGKPYDLYRASVPTSIWEATLQPSLEKLTNIDPRFVEAGYERLLPGEWAKQGSLLARGTGGQPSVDVRGRPSGPAGPSREDDIIQQRLRQVSAPGGGGRAPGGGGGGGSDFITRMHGDLSGLPWDRLGAITQQAYGEGAWTPGMAKEWVTSGGMQTGVDPFHLAGAAKRVGQGLPLSQAQARKALNLSRSMAVHGGGAGGPQASAIAALNQAWGGAMGAQMMAQPGAVDLAWGAGVAGTGATNIPMMDAGLSGAQAMTVDRAMIASGMMGVQGGVVSSTQMGQLKSGLDLARATGATQMSSDLLKGIGGARMTVSGTIPSMSQAGAERAAGSISSSFAGGNMPDMSGSFSQISKRFSELAESTKALKGATDAQFKVLKEVTKLEEMRTGGRAKFVAKHEIYDAPTDSQDYLYQESLRIQTQRTRVAKQELGLFQAQQGAPQQGFFEELKAGVSTKGRGGSKLMSFYDLMYMKRLGQVFWGDMSQAGEEVAQQDSAVSQAMYGAGFGGGAQQGQMGALAGIKAQGRAQLGTAFNQMWSPVMGAAAKGQGALAPAAALGMPMIGASFMANFVGSRFLGLGAAAAGTLGMAAAAATGIAGVVGFGESQMTPTGTAGIGAAWGSEQAGGQGMSALSKIQYGAGAWWSSMTGRNEQFQTDIESSAAAQFAIQTSGYKRDVMMEATPASQMKAVHQRSENIIGRAKMRGIEFDPATAKQLATQMTIMAPRGMTAVQEDKVADAVMMGGDPFGTAAAVHQAITGSPVVAGQTALGSLAMEMSDPMTASRTQAALPFASGVQRTLWGMGADSMLTSSSLARMSEMGWGEQEQVRWGTAASAVAGMKRYGAISGTEALEALGQRPMSQEEMRFRGASNVPRAFSQEEQQAATQFGMYAPGMYQQGMGYVIGAMGQEAGVSGAGMATSPAVGGMLQQWNTSQYARSVMAQDMGLDFLQTLQTSEGFGQGMPMFTAGVQGMGMGSKEWSAAFGRLGIAGGEVAQAFLGESQVSKLTGEAVGGRLGLKYQAQQSQYDRSMQGLGIQGAQLALRRMYTTGEGMPGGRGFWQVQDDQTSLAREQATYGWQTAGRRMGMQQAQFTETFGANVEQFGARTDWQRDTFATKAASMGRQRQWAQEDWAVSDQVREMQWGWQNEDFNENIRFATGRQRRTMERGQERAVTMQNIGSEQIDTQRERQQELWALEDEQFEKSKSRFEESVMWQEDKFEREKRYFDEGMALSEEQHEQEMKFMKKRWALEDEMRNMQREFQKKQMDLSEAALGLQITALKEAKDRQDVQDLLNEAIMKATAASELSKLAGGNAEEAAAAAEKAWRRVLNMIGGGGGGDDPPVPSSGGGDEKIDTVINRGIQRDQVGFSGLVSTPTLFLAGEGRGVGGESEYVSISRMGSGGMPEATGQRDGGTVNVTVILDGEEIASKVMVERGNNLRVEAFR
ncbi:MAG: hypothetical protein KAJ73_03235 [Zetaproteobacteria bacterium]|nr:hypothetical protein [Zetaproteobacteria bacterium]